MTSHFLDLQRVTITTFIRLTTTQCLIHTAHTNIISRSAFRLYHNFHACFPSPNCIRWQVFVNTLVALYVTKLLFLFEFPGANNTAFTWQHARSDLVENYVVIAEASKVCWEKKKFKLTTKDLRRIQESGRLHWRQIPPYMKSPKYKVLSPLTVAKVRKTVPVFRRHFLKAVMQEKVYISEKDTGLYERQCFFR